MRNLKLVYQRTHKYYGIKADLMVQHPLENISFVYFAGILKSINHNTGEIKELCEKADVNCIEFVQINECLCLATTSGEILQLSSSGGDLETVGLISDGIETMQWSPDQELVVFVTKTYNVILMFSTFDVLVESSLHEKAAKEFLTVGWGKKETQFHGSAGKDARKKEEIEIKNIDELDRTITCCWRGDGEYFAVNYVGSNGRMFKVYDKEGVLQYVSELCANLEVPMAWKPSGLWIAKPEINPKTSKYTITLFERNGLKHNEIELPFDAKQERVANLCWNQDSDILLIETLRDDVISALYFYTISNYHWYLKHYVEYREKIIFTWSQNYAEPKQLHLLDSSGNFNTLKFDFVVNHSSGRSVSDESIVAVIDDRKLRLTNFKSKMVPPPMSGKEVQLSERINSVHFLQNGGDSNSFATINFENEINIYRSLLSDAVNGKKLQEVKNVTKIPIPFDVKHCLWINEEKMILASDNAVHLLDIDSKNILEECAVEETIGFIGIVSENVFFTHLIDGSIVNFELSSNNQFSITSDSRLPEFCEKVIGIEMGEGISFYGLKHLKKKLYFNLKEVATEVTSMDVTLDKEFLLFTTIGELKFIRVMANSMDVIETRRIERGSRIVTLVKDKAQVIFQLPRGNLETIAPRILTLRIIKRHLEMSNYRLAFDILRKERINLNLLLDLNPSKFLSEIKEFILQIDNINWLNLFLTELKNEDVTTTMYKFCEKNNDGLTMENKIHFICEKMLAIFKILDAKKYMLPSITCFVKNENFEEALQLIWELKKSETSSLAADEALKYLLYLIDINVLYNIALGMYDYQLVMYVAQKSQKDPKEYVPFLQELDKLDQSYAKYKIDCFLKRYSRAVNHIAVLCEKDEKKFEECVELVKKHSLYEAALIAFENNLNCYKKVCNLFGDHLRIKGKLLEASLMYERGGDFQQALSSARNILDWQRCLLLAKKSGYDESQLKELAEKLIASLADLQRYKESVELVKRFFGDDRKLLIETLVNGRMYTEALLEVTLTGDDEFIESLIKPKLATHLLEFINSFDEDKKAFLQQKERLLQLREEKLRKLQNPQEDDDNHDDMFSDTTSVASQSSRNTAKTFRSSKNKRKYERKLTNLKEGNRFEDLALIDSLWKLVHKIISLDQQNSVKELIKNGIELNLDDKAKNLQKSYKDLLFTIKISLDSIWIDEMLTAGKYPETEEEMENFHIAQTNSYQLVKPEQRFKPKLNVIDFEMEIFRESYTKKNF